MRQTWIGDKILQWEELLLSGGLAVGIPGEVSGYYSAWKMFGRLPWSDLFQPAIRICENGFNIENSLSKAIASNKDYIYNDTNLR